MKNLFRSRPTLGYVLLFVPVIIVYFWKILLSNQFSLLTGGEGVDQGYAWLQYWITSIRHGFAPLWDPYSLAGHSFPGEMQTGAFNPLRLLLVLFPFNHDGVLSPRLYHIWYAAMHFMAAGFMFALIREFGLSRFSALVGGICFSLGGFVARGQWLDMLESAVWLPLVFLFFARALRAETLRKTAVNAALGGLAVALTILAGRLHIVMMELLAVTSAGVFYAGSKSWRAEGTAPRREWLRAGTAVAVLVGIGVAGGAVQLLPSMEYSRDALRFLGAPGALPANQKIPYAFLQDNYYGNAIATLAIPFAFVGNATQGEVMSPYIGFFPLIAAIVGIRRYWSDSWVRYLSGLAVAAFLYCLGSSSPLHGVLYAIVPKLWMMREATRMAYLLDFALVILAAFGIEALISAGREKASWPGLDRVLMWGAVACGVVLFVPAVWVTKPEIGINPWNALSLVIVFASYGMFRFLESGHRGAAARAVLVGLILFDLSAVAWEPRNKMEEAKNGNDQLARILTARRAAQFLKAQPGPFRVRLQADPTLNIGDLYGIQVVDPAHGATLPFSFTRVMGQTDLLNVRYILTPAGDPRPGAIYQDMHWKVFENPTGFPRAWLTHEARVEPSDARASELAGSAGFDARKIAVVAKPVELAPAPDGASEPVVFSALEPNRLAMEVYAASRGMLVASEFYYPAWRATVNGRSAEIYKVDGALRGVIVPPGRSRVEFVYAPASIYAGGALSLIAFLGVGLAAFVERRKAKTGSEQSR